MATCAGRCECARPGVVPTLHAGALQRVHAERRRYLVHSTEMVALCQSRDAQHQRQLLVDSAIIADSLGLWMTPSPAAGLLYYSGLALIAVFYPLQFMDCCDIQTCYRSLQNW